MNLKIVLTEVKIKIVALDNSTVLLKKSLLLQQEVPIIEQISTHQLVKEVVVITHQLQNQR